MLKLDSGRCQKMVWKLTICTKLAKQNVKKELISKNVNLRKLSIKIKAGAIGMKSKKDVQRLPEEKNGMKCNELNKRERTCI